jgi:hypothetical protein
MPRRRNWEGIFRAAGNPSIYGGCGKNIALRSRCCAQARGGPPWPPARRMRRALFFTPLKIPSQSRLLVMGSFFMNDSR